MKTFFKLLLALLLGAFVTLCVLLAVVLRALKPLPGEWAYTLHAGPWSREVSVPAALRIASHPFTLSLLEGHTLRTPYGPVQWQSIAPHTWRAVCAPCTLHVGDLGRTVLHLPRAEFIVVPDIEMNLQGSFALGDGAQALHGHWASRIERSHLTLSFKVADEPVANAFALFRAEIPELKRAQIEGRFNAQAEWRLPAGELSFTPSVQGLRVSGLGTEALLNARPACGAAVDDEDMGSWLPRAVIAAEDQRFYEHTGFDLGQTLAAWQANQQAGETVFGASTLSQQLAKLIYTGDGRDHMRKLRKLRELLYAVELDRTLGKARVLNLYLAMAPWGDGQCGAPAAARHYFGKPASRLSPVEAVWLATLLHNPDRELTLLARNGEVNEARLAWVAGQLRPPSSSPAWRRERAALLKTAAHWSPPRAALTSAMGVAASQAAAGR